ncbi:MAG: YHYH protein [Bacteroidota bacterium]
MKPNHSLTCLLLALVTGVNTFILSQNSKDTFSVTNGVVCNTKVKYKSEVKITTEGDYRIITSNAIPEHKVGKFPNSGNPNSISPQNKTYRISLNPEITGTLISVSSDGFGKGFPAYEFGVAINGVKLEPTAAEFFGRRTSNGLNMDWVLEALSTNTNLGDDCNNAHVQPTGEYHYHGTPWGLIEKDNKNSMQLIGWAADGFPMYYKYGYSNPEDAKSEIKVLQSSYRLRSGERPGDGQSAPDGVYDGTYVRDYEYIQGLGDLDEANGRYGVTPEFPKGTYYYVVTDDFPSLPRYFVGTPSDDFKVGGGMFGGPANRRDNQRGFNRQRSQNRPSVNEVFKMMDTNGDDLISESEAKGPLQQHFDKIDTDNNGFVSKKELRNAPRPDGQHPQRRRQ